MRSNAIVAHSQMCFKGISKPPASHDIVIDGPCFCLDPGIRKLSIHNRCCVNVAVWNSHTSCFEYFGMIFQGKHETTLRLGR